jgi:hypothetical protein
MVAREESKRKYESCATYSSIESSLPIFAALSASASGEYLLCCMPRAPLQKQQLSRTFLKLPVRLALSLLGVLSFLCDPGSASAIQPVRCSGRIQFSPCLDAGGGSRTTTARSPGRDKTPVADPRFPISGKRFAEVRESSFTSISRSTGLWSGVIRGNGLVETELHILRSGKVEAKRYMGHVWLRNKSTTFRITSSLPKGRGWEWEVVAWAR